MIIVCFRDIYRLNEAFKNNQKTEDKHKTPDNWSKKSDYIESGQNCDRMSEICLNASGGLFENLTLDSRYLRRS